MLAPCAPLQRCPGSNGACWPACEHGAAPCAQSCATGAGTEPGGGNTGWARCAVLQRCQGTARRKAVLGPALVQFWGENGWSVPPGLALLLQHQGRGTLRSPPLFPHAQAGGRALRLHSARSSARGNAASCLFPGSTHSAHIRAAQGHVATGPACSSRCWSQVHPQ